MQPVLTDNICYSITHVSLYIMASAGKKYTYSYTCNISFKILLEMLSYIIKLNMQQLLHDVQHTFILNGLLHVRDQQNSHSSRGQ